MDFGVLKARLFAYETKEFGMGATLVEIQQAENALKISFSKSYKYFLTEYGWGGVDDIEIYGLGKDVPQYLDVVEMTLSERNTMEPPLQEHLLPLMNDGFGNHYCLDTSMLDNEECPVVFWDHENDRTQVPKFVSNTFIDWFLEILG